MDRAGNGAKGDVPQHFLGESFPVEIRNQLSGLDERMAPFEQKRRIERSVLEQREDDSLRWSGNTGDVRGGECVHATESRAVHYVKRNPDAPGRCYAEAEHTTQKKVVVRWIAERALVEFLHQSERRASSQAGDCSVPQTAAPTVPVRFHGESRQHIRHNDVGAFLNAGIG